MRTSVSGSTGEVVRHGSAGGVDPLAAIRAVNALASRDRSALIVLQNFYRFVQSAEIVQALAQQIIAGKQNRTFVIVLAPVVDIPTELEKLFTVVEHALPDRQQIEEIAQGVAVEDGGGDLRRLMDAGNGRRGGKRVLFRIPVGVRWIGRNHVEPGTAVCSEGTMVLMETIRRQMRAAP